MGNRRRRPSQRWAGRLGRGVPTLPAQQDHRPDGATSVTPRGRVTCVRAHPSPSLWASGVPRRLHPSVLQLRCPQCPDSRRRQGARWRPSPCPAAPLRAPERGPEAGPAGEPGSGGAGQIPPRYSALRVRRAAAHATTAPATASPSRSATGEGPGARGRPGEPRVTRQPIGDKCL